MRLRATNTIRSKCFEVLHRVWCVYHNIQIRPSNSCCHRSDNNTAVMATQWSKLIPELISIKECLFGGFLDCRVTIPWWGGENLSALPFRNELIWIVEACNDPPAVSSLLLTFKTHFKDLRCCICKCPAVFTTKLFSTPTMLIRKPQIHYVSAYTFDTVLFAFKKQKGKLMKASACGKDRCRQAPQFIISDHPRVPSGENVIYNSLSTPTSRSSHIGKTR